MLPFLAQDVRDRDPRSFWRKLLLVQAGILAACLIAIPIAWFFGDEVIRLLFGPGFKDIKWVLVAGAISAIPALGSSISAFGLTAVGLYSSIMRFYIVVLVVSAVLSVALVPHWGAIGAFVAGGASLLVLQVLSLFAIYRYWRRINRSMVSTSGHQGLSTPG